MRTVDDLTAAFTDLAATAPDTDTLTLPVEPRRPRRLLAPAAAALVTAAVIAGVLIATVPDGDKRNAPASDAVAALPYPAADGPVDTTFGFTADLPGDEPAVRSYSVDRGGQTLEFLRPPSAQGCALITSLAQQLKGDCTRLAMVTLLDAGKPTASDVTSFDPDKLVGRVRQDVDGRRGYFGTQGSGIGAPTLTDATRAVHLFWQYAPGAWADALADSKAHALALATSVRPAERPLTVPVALVPRAHEYLNTIRSEMSSAGGAYDIVSTEAKHGPASVTWGSGRYVKVGDIISLEGTEIGGRTWQFGHSNGQPEARLTETNLPITVSGRVGMSVAELRSYVARLRFAPDLADRGTWLPASELRSPR